MDRADELREIAKKLKVASTVSRDYLYAFNDDEYSVQDANASLRIIREAQAALLDGAAALDAIARVRDLYSEDRALQRVLKKELRRGAR